MTFDSLHNSSALYYYHKKCKNPVVHKLFIQNLNIYNSVGNSRLKMIYIDLADAVFKDNILKDRKVQLYLEIAFL